MKNASYLLALAIGFAAALAPLPALAHSAGHGGEGRVVFDEAYRAHVLADWAASQQALVRPAAPKPVPAMLQRPVRVASTASAFDLSALLSISPFTAPAGNGALMAASFAPFKPLVRYYWDGGTFYTESDNMPANMTSKMVGITSWQQQIPLPASYFASTTNPEKDTASLGYGQPNYWRLPLVPTPAASPIPISAGNFQRGAVALAANGVAIFNPKNNTGRVSYEIGELDAYGGHCGLADDYHYHIIPTHLLKDFGGVLGNDTPVAWALDGYPIYGYLEPDGTARLTLDADGGHSHGAWAYHYHAVGTTAVDATHPYGTPQSPYLMNNFHGTVVNYGGQVDGQPEVGPMRASGTGGYTAQPVSGASIIGYMNPVALTADGSGNLSLNAGGTTSQDQYLMRVSISGTSYDECWQINRNVNPKTVTVTWRLPGATTTTTYASVNSRLTAYPMAAWSQTKLPDTGQALVATGTFGEDSDYTINPPVFTDNGDGTITDNVTGLMWQKIDNGESTWATAVSNTAGISTGGHTDWRLPTPAELFSIQNHNTGNPALNTTYFPSNPSGAADYWWTGDIYGSDATHVWCTNAGGGLGPKPISETLSAGGVLRYSTRYVRGGKPDNGHNYINNNDGTITDADTSLMWTQLPAAAMNWNSALSYAENLALAGYTDWRLPNVKELQTLTDYTLATASTTAGMQPSMNHSMFAQTLTNCATTSGSATVTCDSTTGLISGMPLAARNSLTGAAIAASVTASSVTDSTHFVMSSVATGTSTGLTLSAMAPPTACWSSSVVKAGSLTQAWLVEFGINSSVPGSSGPTRNAQGIISYEIFASTYPVFAVRTTSVATQIAVEQPSGSALTDGVSTVSYGNVNVGSASTMTFVIRNTGSTSLTVSGTTIDGANAANFTVTTAPAASIAAGGSTTMNVQFSAASTGTKTASLHIASSDTAVGAAFDITLSGTGYVPPPAVTNVTTNPAVPTNFDTPYVTATVTPASGATLSQVQLTYSTGAQVTGPVFQEIFANASTASGITGSMNAWTATAVRGAGDVRLAGGTNNHTTPVLLAGCATTSGSTTVTCASTTGLIPGMSLSGTNIAAAATISSITNATTFVISTAATGSGSALSLTAGGVTLAGCSLATSPTIVCASTTGLAVGMGIAGTGLTTNPPGPTVLAITDATHFTVNSTVTAVPATLTATGCGLALSTGTSNYTDTTATTTNVINAGAATAGYVEFYVQTQNLLSNNGWTFQVSPDGGTTWNTRLSENYAGTTVNLTNGTLNATTTVTCASTTGLTTGMVVQGSSLSLSSCGTTSASPTVTCANTTGLAVGMYVSGTGIANGTHVTAMTANTNFTLSANATATGTVTVVANYLNANTTVASITNGTTFVLNAAPFYSGTGIALAATTINHGFALQHYNLATADMTANMKLNFQFSGYVNTPPVKPPTVNIDDITVTLTTGAAPVTLTMYDDGLHGDGAAGDGVYGVQLPAEAAGTTVSYSIIATDSNGSTTTLTSAGSYTTGLGPTITTSTLATGSLGGTYSQTLAASSGTPGYTWSVSAGSLPTGVALSSAGVISGTASTPGTYNFTVKVTDSAGRIGTKALSLIISSTTAPNVLIVLTDDQGWGDIGYHTASGQVPVQTPNMDSIGAQGIRLEKCYVTAVCAVTRSCLLTGRNTLRTNCGNTRGLDLSEHLMPQTFKTAGYQTYMIGKWHIGGWDNNINTSVINGSTIQVIQEGGEYLPFNRGWDVHKGQYGGSIGYFSHQSVDPGRGGLLDWWLNGAPVVESTDAQGNGGYSTDLLADKAVSLIQNRTKTKPMLMYLPFNGVHAGVQAPQSYINKYAGLGVTDTTRRTLCAAVDCMDVALGRVLAALDSEGITNNTLVILMSDNGGDTTTGSINLPLRGTKGDSYDGGIHTPASMRWPGVLPSGVTSDQYVWVGDIFPTICAATSVAPQNTKPFDGINLWPALLAASNSTVVPRPVPLVTATNSPVAFDTFTDPVNGGSKIFKLIRSKSGSTVTNQLFNMTGDPYETTDLLLGANASSYAAIVTTLTADITSLTVENYAPYIGAAPAPQSAQQGTTITLYAPFTAYNKTPTVQWRMNSTALSGATSYFQVTDSTSTAVNGVYMAMLTLNNLNSTHTGSYDVIVTNTTGSVTSQAGTLTVAHPVSTLGDGLPDTWKTAHGIDPASTAAINGPLGDIDGDGRPNLLEYAFNTDPNSAESDPFIASANAGWLQISYPRRIGALDLLYTPEVSTDLASWSSDASNFQVLGTTPNADGVTETVTIRVLPMIGSTVKKFARVRITSQ